MVGKLRREVQLAACAVHGSKLASKGEYLERRRKVSGEQHACAL